MQPGVETFADLRDLYERIAARMPRGDLICAIQCYGLLPDGIAAATSKEKLVVMYSKRKSEIMHARLMHKGL